MANACRQSNEVETVDIWPFVEGAFGFLSDVTHGGAYLVITIENKPVAAIVSVEDMQKLRKGGRK